ncbi:MAG: WD40 repeat domain-containing protein [Pseudomonadota bacterium]
MSGGVSADLADQSGQQVWFQETALEKRGLKLDFGAPVTAAVAVGEAVAVGFGDGTVRFFRPGYDPVVAHAHRGAVLCLEADATHVVTGGDDGRFLRISQEGAVDEIDSFGSRWVDCVVTGRGQLACSSGRIAYVWSEGESRARQLEHPSTVGGLAFDAKGKRLAVAHYGGVTIWERGERRWKPSKLVWKGSHGAISFSPDGKFLVTAMQENALHVWRLRDKKNMQMAGYPAKIKSFTWVGDTPYLATSGADEAICWPFDGKDGPLGRTPVCIAHGGQQFATLVQALRTETAVLVGFQDGAVLLGEVDETKEAVVLRGSTGAEVTALALTVSSSHVLIGDAKGSVLWTPFWAGDEDARHV